MISIHVHLRWVQGGGGERFPSLDVLHQSLLRAWKCSNPSTCSAFPGKDVAPGILQTHCKPQQPGDAGALESHGAAHACPADLSLLFQGSVLFHCCFPSSQGSKF